MLHPPFPLVETWPAPNLVDPVSRNFARVILTAIFTPVVILVVLLRIATRRKITKSFGIDDTLIAFALIPTLGFNACIIAIDLHFFGRVHSWDSPYATDKANLKIYLASQLVFVFSETAIKLSLLCFYQLLLGSTSSPRFNRTILASFIYIGGLSISSLIVTLFSCVPISASFDVFPTYHYTCVSDWQRVAFGSLNFVGDVLVLILPIPIVWSLQMPRSQRLMVIGIFSLSALACIAGLIKIYYAGRVAKSYDIGWEGYGEGFASMLELNLGIICASAPALKPLVKRYWPGTMKTYETWEGPEYGKRSGAGHFIEMDKGTKAQSFKTSMDKIMEEGGEHFSELYAIEIAEAGSGDERSIGLALSKEENLGLPGSHGIPFI